MHKSTKVEKFYLGIDYGMRKTGIAIAQEVTKISRPLKIIYHNHIDEINEIIGEWEIAKIIVGFPNSDHRKEGKIHREIRSFVDDLKKKNNPAIDIILYDEQHSSKLAKDSFAEMRNVGFSKKKDSDYDDISASIILQSWINENIID